eukprot:539007_1
MLPSVKDEIGYGNIGCFRGLNGFQFTSSWHIESQDTIRCYWFRDFGGTLFFPRDACFLWSKYFLTDKLDEDFILLIVVNWCRLGNIANDIITLIVEFSKDWYTNT